MVAWHGEARSRCPAACTLVVIVVDCAASAWQNCMDAGMYRGRADWSPLDFGININPSIPFQMVQNSPSKYIQIKPLQNKKG